MALEPVHVLELDRATSRLELRRINPTREWLEKQDRGMARYVWQNGQWYGTGGDPLDPKDIPDFCKEELEAHPVVVTSDGPAVTAVCQFCGWKGNNSGMEAHLIEHVHDTMKAAGSVRPDYTNDRPVQAKNTLHKTEKA
jgi:hypothetical protein